jgi:phosphoenolpyruvate phosphomutase
VSKAAQLRGLLAGSRLVKAVGAHNPLGARLVERSGFDAVWASSLELSTSFALPDASILTMTEALEAARAMNEAVSIPVIADCDTGYGDVSNVVHMVNRFEASGVAAVAIEDKVFPKVNSFAGRNHDLVSVAEFAEKLSAAKRTQSSADFMVIARTETLIAGLSVNEAIRRAEAYVEAGADAVLVHSKAPDPGEIWAFLERWRQQAPVVVVPTTYFGVHATELTARGVRMVIYANQGIRAAVKAMKDAFRELQLAGSSRPIEPRIASMAELFELQGMRAVLETRR